MVYALMGTLRRCGCARAGKAKRKLGVQRRAIPFLSFYSVTQVGVLCVCVHACACVCACT